MSITERKLKNGKVVYDNQFMYGKERFKKGGFKTKSEAKSWEIEIRHSIDKKGIYRKQCEKTLIEVFNESFEINKEKYNYKPSTINNYVSASKKVISDKISQKRITKIQYSDIQLFFNKLAKSYNKGTCDNIKKLFNMTFKHAIQNEYIQHNPMVYIENKGKETKDPNAKNTVTEDEFLLICNQFIQTDQFNDYSVYVALNIGYYTGARVGEVLALSKNDIDFEKNTISFNKKLEYRDTTRKSYISDMKTKTSYATLPLVPQLKNILLRWFEVNPYDKICCYENGNYYEYSLLQKKLKNVSNTLGIPFHFHMLRHTLATTLVTSGIPSAVAQKILRHANIQTTLNIYTHVDIDHETKALNSIFNTDKNMDYPKITPKLN